MEAGLCPCLRSRVIEFLIRSAQLLEVSPMVKYSALSLFADRFCAVLSSINEKKKGLQDGKGTKSWLLHPIRESNLQLFALISLWISSKIHDTRPLCVTSLKSLGDELIKEQHYTKGDLLEAVLKFGIGISKTPFVIMEELLSQLKVVAQVGVHVKLEACMDIMDLLYENELTSVPYSNPQALASSILVVAYVTTVPLPRWEFPIIPWVKFVTSCKDEEIMKSVEAILKHIFQSQSD